MREWWHKHCTDVWIMGDITSLQVMFKNVTFIISSIINTPINLLQNYKIMFQSSLFPNRIPSCGVDHKQQSASEWAVYLICSGYSSVRPPHSDHHDLFIRRVKSSPQFTSPFIHSHLVLSFSLSLPPSGSHLLSHSFYLWQNCSQYHVQMLSRNNFFFYPLNTHTLHLLFTSQIDLIGRAQWGETWQWIGNL